MSALMASIERLSIPEPNSGCWLWIGALVRSGYGQLTFRGRHLFAHKASYEAANGSIPANRIVCHKCDTRSCVNPAHLYAGTYSDNRRDMLQRSGWAHPYGKRDACRAGHPYTEGSFRIAKDGSRVCRICMREHMRNYRSRNQ